MENHHIICDECGCCPIIGKRYKATNIFDYDCCQSCMRDVYRNDSENFVTFHAPVGYDEALEVGPRGDNRIRASSAAVAEDQYRDGRNAPLAIFRFYQSLPESDYLAITDFIKRHEFISHVEIHMASGRIANYEKAISILAEGLMECKSVRKLYWKIPDNHRKNLVVANSIMNLIENSKSLEVLLLSRPVFLREAFQRECDESEDEFAAGFFEALQKNRSIKIFRIDTVSPLSNATKEIAAAAARLNPCLMQVHATFQEDDCLLDVLTLLNRKQWLKRWTNEKAGVGVRLRVLEEVLEYNCSELTVPILFHLIQNFPEAIQV